MASMDSLRSSTSSMFSCSDDESVREEELVPRLPLGRGREGSDIAEPRRTASSSAAPTKWLSGMVQHPLISTIGAVLTIILPTRVASTLASYASRLDLAGGGDDDDAQPPPPPPGGEQSPWDEGFGFYVSITPGTPGDPTPLFPFPRLLGADYAADDDEPPPPSHFQTFSGSTPPLVRAPARAPSPVAEDAAGSDAVGEATVDDEG